jgi:hypothetical protein
MPHNEGGGGGPKLEIAANFPTEAIFDGHPITITGDLELRVPEPHSMVPVGRKPGRPESEQRLRLFTLIGVDQSPRRPRLERGNILGIEIKIGNGRRRRVKVSGKDCEIRIFFTHLP